MSLIYFSREGAIVDSSEVIGVEILNHTPNPEGQIVVAFSYRNGTSVYALCTSLEQADIVIARYWEIARCNRQRNQQLAPVDVLVDTNDWMGNVETEPEETEEESLAEALLEEIAEEALAETLAEEFIVGDLDDLQKLLDTLDMIERKRIAAEKHNCPHHPV